MSSTLEIISSKAEKQDLWMGKIFSVLLPLSLTYYLFILPFHLSMADTENHLYYIITDISGLFASFIALIAFYKFKSQNISVSILIGTALIILTASLYRTGGMMSPAAPWIVLFPVVLGFSSGKKGALIGGGIALLLIGYLIILNYVSPDLTGEASYNVFFIQTKGLIGSSLFMTVVTFLSQKSLEHKYNQLTQSTDKVHELLQIIGHDIRNPISLIRNSNRHILRDAKSCEELTKTNDQSLLTTMNNIVKATDIIMNTIEQIREIQALDRGKKEILIEAVSIKEIIKQSEFIMSEELKDKKIKLLTSFDNDEDYKVYANTVHLSMNVVSAIISNSIKFSYPESTIHMFICQISNDQIVIEIKDQGIGIPDSLLGDLFNATKKNIRVGTKGEKGTGFSLPIAEKYIHKFGGHIEFYSKNVSKHPSDHGTVFSLFLNTVPFSDNNKKAA